MEGGVTMKVWKYGDGINTDMLFPGKYTYTCSTPEEIMPHLLEDLDPGFAKAAKAGDVIMAGDNFGCGSSREQPTVGLKALGIKAVVARSFARIFYRSAINQGLVLVECPQAIEAYRQGDEVDVKPEAGKITVGDKEFTFPKLPPEIIAIRDAGGLLSYVREQLKERGTR
jgi:3-isopropylmalate/(R)-2-methylmalate dehydratase small subunit